MSALGGQGGELRATVTITRKATGKKETHELVGRTTPEEHEQIMKEIQERGIEAVLGAGAQLKEVGDGHA